jgi:GNAT superfamily N-acetyltransferase
MAQIPAAPGTTPIPDNYVRLYHYTGAEPEQIAREGLRMQYAKGENYSEPNQIWASARFPEGSAIYNPVVEFAVPVGDPRWNIGKMESGIRYNPDATGTGKEWNPEEHVQHYKKHLEDHGSHVTFGGDIDPSEILAIHEPWHPHYRYYQENGIDPNEHQWMHETMPNSPEARAMKEYEKTLGQWRRQTYYPPQGGGDPRPDWMPSEHHDQLVEPMTATPLGPCEKCGDGMQRDAEGVYCPSCGNRANADVQNSRIYEYAPLGEGIGEGPFGLMSKQAAEPEETIPFVGEVWRDLEGNAVQIVNLHGNLEDVQVKTLKDGKTYWFPIKDLTAHFTPVSDSWGREWKSIPEDQNEWNEMFQNIPEAFKVIPDTIPEHWGKFKELNSALNTEPYPGMPTERPDLPPGVLYVTNPYEDRRDNDFVFDRTPALHFPETGTLAVGERGQTHGDLRRNIGIQGYQLPGYGWEHELWGAQPAYDTPEMWKATEYAEGDANGLPVPGGWSHRDAFPLMKQVRDVPIYTGLKVVGSWKLARTTMYHVSPVQRRDSIKAQGLIRQKDNPTVAESPWFLANPPGIYLWDTPQNAHIYAQRAQAITDPDIWAVDVTGLNLKEDPFFTDPYEMEQGQLNDFGDVTKHPTWAPYPTPGQKDVRQEYRGPHGMPGAFVTQDNIPPDRLHLAYPNPWKPEPGIKNYWNEDTEQFEGRPTMLNVSAANVTVEEMPAEMLSGYQGVGFRGRPIRLAIREPNVNSTHPYFKDNNLAAFADVFDEGNGEVNIGFINTAPEMQGRGLARQLVQAVYDQFPNAKIRWGKLMDDAMVHLKDQFKQQFPERTAEWKLARTTLYHVTNSKNRDSIMEHGLDPSYAPGRDYLWMWDSLPKAQEIAKSSWGASRNNDIWAVDATDLNLQRDPHARNRGEDFYTHPMYYGAWATMDAIPPDRLEHVDNVDVDDNFIQPWLRQTSWKFSIAGIPAQYSEDDPLDLQGKQPVFDNMQVDWWNLPEEEQRHAVVNAFRATMLSPRLRLRDNAIMYQEMMAIPAEESDPDVFEQHARSVKEKWDRQGQGDLMGDVEPMGWEQQVPGKLTPGFWTNIRRLAALGPYSEKLRQAALADIQENGGKGNFFRDEVLRLGIPGVGPKVASFAWLALNPKGSDLGTLDVWMMRHLNQDVESPNNPSHYFDLENQLRDEKDALYGPQTPLGQYQWGVWDKIRTPGLHQDHSPLRVYDPTPYNQVAWGDFARGPRPPIVQPQIPGQEQLFAKRSSAIVNAMWEENEEYGLLYRAPEEQLAHDYHPSWDQIEDENINPEAAAIVKKICERIYSETQMPFEVWAVQLPKEAVAMYINGTSGYPVILLDLAKHVGYEDQYWQSIVHELRHAEQEANSEGDANFDEEEAENSERMPFSAY